ncbi:hypothetical protein TSUD_322640 [Trifolium subterraneum]|uniref:Putative plant transposon protein domain-containing protein n=1 Tax=Trifolium subterraneum TaxID=3900 RepID=A0A2Z6LZE5_TRISU|nr:hypothetical protein TSUD_322640 [Trifolium subterraneum]
MAPRKAVNKGKKKQTTGENVFRLTSTGDFARFTEIIEERGWVDLARPADDINFDLVREFYANAMPIDDEDPVTFKTMSVAQGNWDVSALTQSLLRPGHQLIWNTQNTYPVRAKKDDLTIPSQLLLHFTLHNVMPRSHTSDGTMKALQFMYYMENNLEIDVARVIVNELREMVVTGLRTTKMKSNAALGFPGLIMEARRVCKYKHTTIFIDSAGGQSSTPPPANPNTFPPTGYPPMDPTTFHNMVTYNWDLHDAGFRAMQAVHQSIYNTQVLQPVMSPDQFRSYVQWPEVRPFIPGGGSSSGAGTDAGTNVGGGTDTDVDDDTTLREMMNRNSFANRDGNNNEDIEMVDEDEATASGSDDE